jgi:hypothetical protein
MLSSDDLVTISLVYLSIGAVLWLVLDGLGMIDISHHKDGRPMRNPAAVIAAVSMIVQWPRFAWVWIKGARGMAK